MTRSIVKVDRFILFDWCCLILIKIILFQWILIQFQSISIHFKWFYWIWFRFNQINFYDLIEFQEFRSKKLIKTWFDHDLTQNFGPGQCNSLSLHWTNSYSFQISKICSLSQISSHTKRKIPTEAKETKFRIRIFRKWFWIRIREIFKFAEFNFRCNNKLLITSKETKQSNNSCS